MQKYIIKTISETNTLGERNIYERDERSGNYLNTGSQRISKSLMDFFGSNIKILAIIRTSDNEVFKIEDIIALPNNRNLPINKIFFDRGLAHLEFTGPLDRIMLINAVKYKEKVAKKVETTVKRKYTKKEDKVSEPKFKELQDKIIKSYPREIRLQKTLKRTPFKMGLEKFLIKFFLEYNSERATIYVDDSSIQTPIGRRRSLGDIYMICKYYFPEVTLEEVIKMLYVTLPSKITDGFRNCKCGQILKRVWYYSKGAANNTANAEVVDEYGHLYKYYIDQLNKK